MKNRSGHSRRNINPPERRKDGRVKLRLFMGVFGFLASLGMAIVSYQFDLTRGHAGWIISLCVVSAVLCVLAIFAALLLGIRCKNCRRRLRSIPTTQQSEGYAPLHYFCPHCNIEWETGLVLGSPD